MAELKKVLSFRVILLITINSIMGTGIFFLPAVGAKASGPASLLAWIILSFISIYIAMCFGELVSMFPKSGGIYEFCKQSYGRFTSFLIGWTTVIAGNVTIAMLVVGAIQYLMPVGSTYLKIIFSLIFIFAFNFIAYKGMKTSAVMLIAFAFITLFTIISLIIPGLWKLQLGNFSPFFVSPFSSLMLTIFLIAETFFGWETATFLAEETQNGAKVMPKALVYGTIIIAVICVLSVITSIGVIPWNVFGQSSAPLADLAVVHYGVVGNDIFAILVYLAIIGSVAGWIVSAPRLLLAMAKDKLFLTQFAKIHHKNNTPHLAIIFQTVLTTILVIVGAGSYTTLLHLLVPLVLVMYSFVLLCVVVLRYKRPHAKRHYRAPFGKIGPIIVSLFMVFLIYMWLKETSGAYDILKLGISLVVLGIPVYFLIEMYYSAPAIKSVNAKLAYFLIIFENLVFPFGLRKRVFLMLGDLKNKRVLEYGCSSGALTRRLSKKVLPRGKVYVTDVIDHNVQITAKQLNRRSHLKFFYHDSLSDFKTKIKLPHFDAVVSTGVFSYLQNPAQVLKDISRKMRPGSHIVILDYTKFFHILPNVPWISDDEKLKRMFKNAGFEIQITKKRGLLWQHVFIHGEKI